MVTVQEVRDLGGWEGLDDEHLQRLIIKATSLVRMDVATFGVSPSAEELDHLVELKTCALAERLQRVPVSESAGGLSASYLPLSWWQQYGEALARLLKGYGKIVPRPVM
jgi:hypothetical protein